jgi:hypothetical protein
MHHNRGVVAKQETKYMLREQVVNRSWKRYGYKNTII